MRDLPKIQAIIQEITTTDEDSGHWYDHEKAVVLILEARNEAARLRHLLDCKITVSIDGNTYVVIRELPNGDTEVVNAEIIVDNDEDLLTKCMRWARALDEQNQSLQELNSHLINQLHLFRKRE